MSIEINDDGTISLYQGDSGEIVVSGIDTSTIYEVYFAIQDKKRNLVGNELKLIASNVDTVSFFLTPEFTDLLKVPDNKSYEIYYYGIKVVEKETNTENTLFVKNSSYGDLNQIIVYPKKVSGP